MRIPIFRNLDNRLEVFGLSPLEIGVICGFFVLVSEVFSFIPMARLIALVGSLGVGLGLRLMHQRCESHFLEKVLRFIALPDGLKRKVVRKYDEPVQQKNKLNA